MIIKTILVLVIVALWASPASAVFRAQIEVTPQDGFNEILVTILDSTPPAGPYVGYAVVCYLHSECTDPVFVSDVTDFSEPLEFTDNSPPEHSAYTYVVSWINEAGEPAIHSGEGSQATLGGLEHPIIRGDLRDPSLWSGSVFPCTDSCIRIPYTWGVGVLSSAPDAFLEAKNSGQVFDVFGEIVYTFEGAVFALVSKAVPTTCDAPLSSQVVTWSTLKSLYR